MVGRVHVDCDLIVVGGRCEGGVGPRSRGIELVGFLQRKAG